MAFKDQIFKGGDEHQDLAAYKSVMNTPGYDIHLELD